MEAAIKQRFLFDSDQTGRFIVKSFKTGVQYYVEPIGSVRTDWGDLNPSTKKIEGTYGQKHKGSINEKESLLTEENGFKNIVMLSVGVSPFTEIYKRDLEYEKQGRRPI